MKSLAEGNGKELMHHPPRHSMYGVQLIGIYASPISRVWALEPGVDPDLVRTTRTSGSMGTTV